MLKKYDQLHSFAPLFKDIMRDIAWYSLKSKPKPIFTKPPSKWNQRQDFDPYWTGFVVLQWRLPPQFFKSERTKV